MKVVGLTSRLLCIGGEEEVSLWEFLLLSSLHLMAAAEKEGGADPTTPLSLFLFHVSPSSPASKGNGGWGDTLRVSSSAKEEMRNDSFPLSAMMRALIQKPNNALKNAI